MKFRLLEAEILTYQGRRPDVLALLNGPDVSYPVVGDIAIKRDLLCGLAHAGSARRSKPIWSCRRRSACPMQATPA